MSDEMWRQRARAEESTSEFGGPLFPDDPADGTVIRLTFPALTEERRREFVKVVKHMAEEGRVAVRNLRREARKAMEATERSGEISADELERAEKELEKITHDHVESIDAALGRKESELLEV